MPRPIPHSLAESLPVPQSGEPASGEVLRVLGGVGLPGEVELTRMGRDGASKELGNLSWEAANEVHQKTARLFAEVIPTLQTPELSDFIEAGVDFAHLRAGYETYDQARLRPELVFAPVSLPILTWRGAYSALREWQDTNHPDSAFKLKNPGDGDGLFITEPVAQSWPALNQLAVAATPGAVVRGPNGEPWKALVVPTASKEQHGLAVNTSYDLTKKGADFLAQVAAIGASQVGPTEAHMPIGVYLTLQAGLILKDDPLLDSDTWTWNAGTFEHENRTKAPASRWYPGGGRVSVGRGGVGGSDGYVGARLPVWG